ncbi:MAG: hypothetical protein H8D78_21745, partial [Chloroflexi bacterium]|nr:hypothetical protein [Chloroflexota bacterium]
GVIRIVVPALAQASFAGLTGYFLGRAKFEDEPVTGFSTSRTQELSPGRGWRPSAWRT